jgi:hypothetical protein
LKRVTQSSQFGLVSFQRSQLTVCMNKRSDKQQRRARRQQARASSQDEWAGYRLGDAIVGGSAFNPMTGKFELDGLLDDPGTVQVIGSPSSPFSEPRMREATLDDCEDDCPLCQELRRQILSGNPPQVMAFD